MNFLTILVVEDDPSIRSLMRIHLERSTLFKCRIVEQDSIEGALGILEHNGIDVVVLDAVLPGHKGIEYSIREIRKVSEKVAICALSAYFTFEEALRATEQGADRCEEKTNEAIEHLAWSLAIAVTRRAQVNKEKEVLLARIALLEKPSLSSPSHPWWKRRSFWVKAVVATGAIAGAIITIAKALSK